MPSMVEMYSKPRPITVDTIVPPPEEPGPSIFSTDGYFRPRDVVNPEIVRSCEIKRSNQMQAPRQLLLAPQSSRESSWPCVSDKAPKSPTIVISPPSEEHLPTIPIGNSPVPKHRKSMLKAVFVASFVILSVVGLIILFIFS